MARIFMTGFEAGHTSAVLVSSSGVSISAAQVRTGDYSLHSNGGYGLTNPFEASAQEIYGRVGVRAFGYPEDYQSHCIHDFLDSAGQKQCGFAIGELGSLEFWRRSVNAGTLLAESAPTVFPLNEWVCLEYYIKVDDAAGEGVFRIDGVEVLSFSGDTQATATANVAQMWIGVEYRGFRAYIDDIAINDVSGAVNNSWIGRGGIYGLVPNGAGTHTDFTPSAGDNYAAVDEVPPNDDTDYVESDTVGHKDTYALGDLVPVSGDIQAVQWIARAKLDAAGSGNFQRLIRHDSVDYNSGDLAVDTSYKYFTEIIEKAPDDTDWTIAKVNALEAGMEVS